MNRSNGFPELLDIERISFPKNEKENEIEKIRSQIGGKFFEEQYPKAPIKKEPELIEELDNDNYVYAKCQCPVPIQYAIRIPKEPGQIRYRFTCEKCGCGGEVIVSK